MDFSSLIAIFLLCVSLAEAVPTPTVEPRAVCSSPGKRRAWHTLSKDERLSYLNAELCLMKKPATLGLKAAKTRYDELHYSHVIQAWSNHFTGSFLPFHRFYMYTHEKLLREECNYTGYQPYWQEQLDAGKFSKATAILDPVYGFGGDGSGSNSCIKDGPFKDYVNQYGPDLRYQSHCIDRRIDDTMSQRSAKAQVDNCLAQTSWATAWACIERNPHTGGHLGVGQEMSNGVSSPGDPLFWLHHTWLDKIWADWQAKDSKRLTEMGGTNIFPPNAIFPPRPPEIPAQTGAPGDPAKVTTLGHVLDMKGIVPNATIGDIMDTKGGFLCYEYVEPSM